MYAGHTTCSFNLIYITLKMNESKNDMMLRRCIRCEILYAIQSTVKPRRPIPPSHMRLRRINIHICWCEEGIFTWTYMNEGWMPSQLLHFACRTASHSSLTHSEYRRVRFEGKIKYKVYIENVNSFHMRGGRRKFIRILIFVRQRYANKWLNSDNLVLFRANNNSMIK